MKSVACGRYIIKQKLGAGSFGEIHRGEDKETGQSVAIKLEPVKTHVPQLSYESKLYNIFKNGVNIPKFYWFGTESSHNSMVIELLGKSLEDISAQFPHHRLSLKTVLMLADQMLSAVQYIHLMNFIHRDIKPDNFVMGIGKNSNKIFIIDFGLSKKYRDPHNHQHIKYTERKDLTGTARYASLAALKGIEQSRRDDLEALGFVWLYLLRGDLPWMGLDAHNRRQKYDRICQVKEETSFESLCSGFPDEFVRYFYNVRSLRFIEEPDYSHFRKMFRKLFIRLGYIYDYKYDWTVTTSHKQRSSHEVYNTLNNTTHVKPKEQKPKADFLSDREKRPKMPLNIPNQEKNKQKSKSRRGINEIQNTLDAVNVNMSTAPQLSQKKGEYAKDTNDQNRVKNNIKKSKRFGKSEADAYPRIQVPRPKNDISDSTSSDDQLHLSQIATKRVMRSTNTNASGNLNSVSRRTMISKTPNRNSQNYMRLDRSELELYRIKSHPLSPIPTSTPNLTNSPKYAKNINNNANDSSSYSNKNENDTQNNNESNNITQQIQKKELNKNTRNAINEDEYYSSESYSYEEEEIEAKLQNQFKKQIRETNANTTENENDNDKAGKRSHRNHPDAPVRVNSNPNIKNSKSPNTESYKQKSKSPGRSDGYTNGTGKRKAQHNKTHFNSNNYNTGDDETALQARNQRQKRNDVNPEQNPNDTTNNLVNNTENKKKKKTNSSSSEEHLNELNELNMPLSAPIPTPPIPSLVENSIINSDENNNNKEPVNEQKQTHTKPEKQRINNANANTNYPNNRTKLRRSNSNSIKQKGILDSSSSQDGPPIITNQNMQTIQSNQQQTQHNSKQRNSHAKKPNQNENSSYNSLNGYNSSNSNSSFNFEQRKDPISKTPQRSTAHYATTNSAANPNPKQDIKNSRAQQIAETPDRARNTRISYQARHHTDVVRDKRIPIPDLSESVSSSSSYNDNNNSGTMNSNRNKIRTNSGRHQHSDRLPNERRKEKSIEKDRDHYKSKDKSSNLRAGGETDVGVIQQRLKMPKPDRDIRRERDRDREKNDEDLDAFESMNLSSKNIGRRSEALIQSRSPNLRPVPRPGAKKKLLNSKDRRNSLRPSAMIPNWMNEKFKGRK